MPDSSSHATITSWAELDAAARVAAREFCLDVIADVYGVAYRRDWHGDLDSLAASATACQFSAENKGAFWVMRDGAGATIATCALKRLAWQPHLIAKFAARYPTPEAVCTLVRAYVRADARGHGIGARLVELAERQATALGYDHVYLHTHAGGRAEGFWRRHGYVEFARDADTAHFDKLVDRDQRAGPATRR